MKQREEHYEDEKSDVSIKVQVAFDKSALSSGIAG
jgi:hypothetical protein